MSFAAQVETESGTNPIGSLLYGICTTAAATAAKVVEFDDFDTLLTGTTIHIKFTYSNTAGSPTLAIGSTEAKPIYRYGTTAPGTTEAASWKANSVVSLTYDGTAWRINDVGAEQAIADAAANALASSDAATRAKIAPTYSAASTYAVGAIVFYDGNLYKCTTAISTAEAWDSTHWSATTIAAELADRESKALVFTNKSASFSSGNGITNFGYRAAVACSGVTSSMIPYVAFSGNDAGSGKYANYCQTYNGGVYVYANASGSTTIPVIICWRP